MFADPQSVTVNAVAESLKRIKTGDQRSTYRSVDGEFELTVTHDEKNRCRRAVVLTQKIVAEDPFLTGTNRSYSQSASLVLNHPAVGFTSTQIDNLAQALVDYASDALIDQIIAGES